MPIKDIETPNDDNTDDDEDNNPTGTNLLYSFDAPSGLRDAGGDAFTAIRNTFREWVRVKFDSATFANKNGQVEGSRSSDYVPWYLLDYQVRHADGEYVPDTNAVSSSAPAEKAAGNTGNGTMSVTLLANPATEGYITTYDLAAQKWTLISISNFNANSFTQVGAVPEGTTWTIMDGTKAQVTITQGATAFADGDSFTFSVFETSSMGGKKNEINSGTIDPTDGP